MVAQPGRAGSPAAACAPGAAMSHAATRSSGIAGAACCSGHAHTRRPCCSCSEAEACANAQSVQPRTWRTARLDAASVRLSCANSTRCASAGRPASAAAPARSGPGPGPASGSAAAVPELPPAASPAASAPRSELAADGRAPVPPASGSGAAPASAAALPAAAALAGRAVSTLGASCGCACAARPSRSSASAAAAATMKRDSACASECGRLRRLCTGARTVPHDMRPAPTVLLLCAVSRHPCVGPAPRLPQPSFQDTLRRPHSVRRAAPHIRREPATHHGRSVHAASRGRWGKRFVMPMLTPLSRAARSKSGSAARLRGRVPQRQVLRPAQVGQGRVQQRQRAPRAQARPRLRHQLRIRAEPRVIVRLVHLSRARRVRQKVAPRAPGSSRAACAGPRGRPCAAPSTLQSSGVMQRGLVMAEI